MADRQRTFYDEMAAIDDACGQGQCRMREVRPNDVPSGSSHYNVNGRTMVGNDEWDEMATREAIEASLRSQENWSLARDAVSATNAFRYHGNMREENRQQADLFEDPMQYGREWAGGPRAVSPRSQDQRNRAAAAAAAANGPNMGASGARRRKQQEGQRMSQSGQKRAIRRMREKHSLQDDQKTLSLQLMATAGYYFGTFQDQYYQQMIERATRDLGEDAPDLAIHSRATHYYDERYHPDRVRSSSSSSSSSNSRPSHSGPKALDIPEEIREMYDDHPNWFICPITQDLMIDPVILSSGHTYERSAITEHLRRNNNRDPITNLKLKNKTLTPNMALRHSITAHITRMANTPVQQNNPNNKKSRKKNGKHRKSGKGGARNVKTRRRKKSRRKSRKRKSKKKKKKYK